MESSIIIAARAKMYLLRMNYTGYNRASLLSVFTPSYKEPYLSIVSLLLRSCCLQQRKIVVITGNAVKKIKNTQNIISFTSLKLDC